MRVGTLWQFIGAGFVAGVRNALFIGTFFVLVGVPPWQFFASLIQEPPGFLHSWVFGPGLVLLGIAIIGGSLWFNLWSRRQICIDELSEDMSWAIHNLLNKPPTSGDASDIQRWWGEVVAWEAKVDKKLENRAFFTRSDQLHFGVLGFVDSLRMTGDDDLDHMLSQLGMKFERLRDVINWSQMRRR